MIRIGPRRETIWAGVIIGPAPGPRLAGLIAGGIRTRLACGIGLAISGFQWSASLDHFQFLQNNTHCVLLVRQIPSNLDDIVHLPFLTEYLYLSPLTLFSYLFNIASLAPDKFACEFTIDQ